MAFAPLQRHIASAENIGCHRPSECVYFNAGIGGQAQIASDRVGRLNSNSNKDDVRLQFGSIGQANAVRCPCRDRNAKFEPDTMVAVPCLDDFAHKTGKRPGE